MSGLFHPASGLAWYGCIVGATIAFAVFTGVLMQTPARYRRYLIQGLTFLGGLYFALEFFWPTHLMPTKDDPTHVGNFLTPGIVPFGNISPVIAGTAVGLGVINLFMVHGKRLIRRAPDSFNSAVFFTGMFTMLVVNILQKAHPNSINQNLNSVLYDGGLASLDATMFSLVAFYIVSAAYRAFRVRSIEATLLLLTAVVVMLGQISVGQLITYWIPYKGFLYNLHIEVIRNWVLTIPNAASTRAIAFGLGIGSLAVALRIWLGLERGSYFEGQR